MCKLPAYQNIETSQSPEIFLDQETSIQQNFTNSCKQIQALEVLIGEKTPDARGSIRFSLLSNTGDQIINKTFDVSSLTPKDSITLDLKDDTILDEGDYTISLEPRDLTGKVGLAIRDVDVYPGVLTTTKGPINGDLIFYFFCAPVSVFKY